MNPKDFIKMMQQHTPKQEDVPLVLIDKFIEKCTSIEGDFTLYSLGQSISFKLQKSPMISFEEQRILPLVLKRIQEKLNKGEK